jgi:DNA alkylation damage repair protein AlkB
MELIEVHPGVILLRGFLDLDDQIALARRCFEIGSRPAGFYTPVVRGGASMSIKMVCLGRHWNAKTYCYQSDRADYDGLEVQELPSDLKDLARRVATRAGMALEPDICLINYYSKGARLGLHQDKDEQKETIAAGIPVVSVSLGDSARFLVGGLKRKDAVEAVILASGDAIVMGGVSRLRYHGVSRVIEGTAPENLGVNGRLNLNFRQY